MTYLSSCMLIALSWAAPSVYATDDGSKDLSADRAVTMMKEAVAHEYRDAHALAAFNSTAVLFRVGSGAGDNGNPTAITSTALPNSQLQSISFHSRPTTDDDYPSPMDSQWSLRLSAYGKRNEYSILDYYVEDSWNRWLLLPIAITALAIICTMNSVRRMTVAIQHPRHYPDRSQPFWARMANCIYWITLIPLTLSHRAFARCSNRRRTAPQMGRTPATEVLDNDCEINEDDVDRTPFLVACIRRNFSQEDKELRLSAIADFLAIQRYPEESISALLAR